MYRIGHGYDVHKLVKDRRLVLGGVEIPHDKGLLGHSDADVLIHSICDALLGAAALGDIGRHFPDTSPAFKDADSRDLLRDVMKLIYPYKVVNVDATILVEAPKILPHVAEMRAKLSEDIGVSIEHINIKATTTEKLGFIGREEGIAAEAVVLLQRGDELDVRELGV